MSFEFPECEESGECGPVKVFNENFPNLEKNINVYIQEAEPQLE